MDYVYVDREVLFCTFAYARTSCSIQVMLPEAAFGHSYQQGDDLSMFALWVSTLSKHHGRTDSLDENCLLLFSLPIFCCMKGSETSKFTIPDTLHRIHKVGRNNYQTMPIIHLLCICYVLKIVLSGRCTVFVTNVIIRNTSHRCCEFSSKSH